MEAKALNQVDREYQELLLEIIKEGQVRDTRAGMVKSLFGKQINFDLQQGYPLLTTKKVYFKGVAHELLWFLQHPYNSHGSMNIHYLNANNIHIWDDDAYRWFNTWVCDNIISSKTKYSLVRIIGDDNMGELCSMVSWEEGNAFVDNFKWLLSITKETFLKLVEQRIEIRTIEDTPKIYRFGDLGSIYGSQWRSYGCNGIDQIASIIDTLKNNPTDRRMLCLAYNPSVLKEIALPPCHVMMQFYSRELTSAERWEIFRKKYVGENDSADSDKDYDRIYHKAMSIWTPTTERHDMEKELDNVCIPKRGLSCMWTQRSVDCFLGLPFNIASYALLTYMIGHVVGMAPDKLIGSLGDCHIYLNHMEAVHKQLERTGNSVLPNLEFSRDVDDIDDFKYEDFIIENYKPDESIKAKLNVG